MKVRLKVLLNKPRGGAWPSSARAVTVCANKHKLQQKCHVKSCNERDLCLQLPARVLPDRAHCRNCLGNKEEGAGNGRSVCPESSGRHARNNGRDNGIQLRKEKLNL